MRNKGASPDEEVARIAARQHTVWSRADSWSELGLRVPLSRAGFERGDFIGYTRASTQSVIPEPVASGGGWRLCWQAVWTPFSVIAARRHSGDCWWHGRSPSISPCPVKAGVARAGDPYSPLSVVDRGSDSSPFGDPDHHACKDDRGPAPGDVRVGMETGGSASRNPRAATGAGGRDGPNTQRPRAGFPATMPPLWPAGPGGQRQGGALDRRLPLAAPASCGRDRQLRLSPWSGCLPGRPGARSRPAASRL